MDDESQEKRNTSPPPELKTKEKTDLERALEVLAEVWFRHMEWLLVIGALFYLAQLTDSAILWFLSIVSVLIFVGYFISTVPGINYLIRQMTGYGWKSVVIIGITGIFIVTLLVGALLGLVAILAEGGVQ